MKKEHCNSIQIASIAYWNITILNIWLLYSVLLVQVRYMSIEPALVALRCAIVLYSSCMVIEYKIVSNNHICAWWNEGCVPMRVLVTLIICVLCWNVFAAFMIAKNTYCDATVHGVTHLQTQLLVMYHVVQCQAHSQRYQDHVKLLLSHAKLSAKQNTSVTHF